MWSKVQLIVFKMDQIPGQISKRPYQGQGEGIIGQKSINTSQGKGEMLCFEERE